MKTLFHSIIIAFLFCLKASAQLYITQTGEASFFSKTPIEDISAMNKQVAAIVNITTAEIAVKIQNAAFRFPNKLMEEHFNENYMESEKFPNSTFRGKIQEAIDFKKEGVYDVLVKGMLDIHGVKQEKILKGKITIGKDKLSIDTNFDVKLADHKIDIPTLVLAKIAESIAVTCNFVLIPKK